jgi:SAM-dependent methyltransferase
MALGWINPSEYPFSSLLLFERFQIRMMLWIDDAQWRRSMGIALHANPTVAWYLKKRCPECAEIVDALLANATPATDAAVIRAAEVYVLSVVDEFVLYTTPERMDSACDFIYAWDKSRLFEMADFAGKTVLDCGSGSGRLAFAVAERAKFVVASEPVGTLREYLHEKIARDGITNMKVCDGLMENLPFSDNMFDIVMSGHVMSTDAEEAEAARVCKSGGWVLDCPGESKDNAQSDPDALAHGYEELYYRSTLGGDVYRYRKQILK